MEILSWFRWTLEALVKAGNRRLARAVAFAGQFGGSLWIIRYLDTHFHEPLKTLTILPALLLVAGAEVLVQRAINPTCKGCFLGWIAEQKRLMARIYTGAEHFSELRSDYARFRARIVHGISTHCHPSLVPRFLAPIPDRSVTPVFTHAGYNATDDERELAHQIMWTGIMLGILAKELGFVAVEAPQSSREPPTESYG